jgi:hypothetical protein
VGDLDDLRGGSMDELGAELDWYRAAFVADGVDASADAIPGFDDFGGEASLLKAMGSGEAGDAGADDEDVGGRHSGVGTRHSELGSAANG